MVNLTFFVIQGKFEGYECSKIFHYKYIYKFLHGLEDGTIHITGRD